MTAPDRSRQGLLFEVGDLSSGPMEFIVPEDELQFRASRAGGPGGQHVNKTSTRIEVVWDVRRSPSLTATQRARLLRKLGNRIDSGGRLRVVAGDRRSQWRNRQSAIERLTALVQEALRTPRARKPTKPPRSAAEKRLSEKRRRSELKRKRRPAPPED